MRSNYSATVSLYPEEVAFNGATRKNAIMNQNWHTIRKIISIKCAITPRLAVHGGGVWCKFDV